MELVQKREFSDEKRKELADKGHAMPDGSFPIENITDLHNAVQSIGRSKNYAKTKAHIIERAKALGATSVLPEDWKITKFIDDVKDAIEKAIGTSSSANQEADERSVENYVRGNSNTNMPTDGIGGNIMSNTTEPDPQGAIAVNKVINGETAPAGNESVSDAPNDPGIVPNNETFPGEGSAVAPTSAEMAQADKVTITKSSTCPDCGGSIVHECMGKADASADENKVEKAASADEVTEDNADDQAVTKAADEVESKEEDAKETAADEKAEMKKSLWGGAFAPVTPKF